MRSEERERSPKGKAAEALAQAAADAAAAAAAEEEEEHAPTAVSEDDMPDEAPPADEAGANVRGSAADHIAELRLAALEARTTAEFHAMVLRQELASNHIDASRVEAGEAQAIADAAEAALAAALAVAAGAGAPSTSTSGSSDGIAAAFGMGGAAAGPAAPVAAAPATGAAAPAASSSASGIPRPERIVPLTKAPPLAPRAAENQGLPFSPSPASRRASSGGEDGDVGEVAARRAFIGSAFSPSADARAVPGSDGDADEDEIL